MQTVPVFGRTKPTSILALASFVGVHILLKALFFSQLFLERVADPVYDATDGMIAHSTSASIVLLAAFCGFVFCILRLRARDLGLSVRNLVNAVFVTVFVWSMAQGLAVLVGRIDGGDIFYGQILIGDTVSTISRMGQAIGASALVEELIYRGFLVPQLFLVLLAAGRWKWPTCLVVSIVATQAYFAASHGPAALRMGLSPSVAAAYIVQVFVVGLLFAAVYLRTGNLLVAVGLHGLINLPGLLFESAMDSSFIMLVLSCSTLLLWPYLSRVFNDIFTMRPDLVPSSVSQGNLQLK